MSDNFKSYFQPTRSERLGAVILCFICFVGFCTPSFYGFFDEKSKVNFSAFKEEIALFMNEPKEAQPIVAKLDTPTRNAQNPGEIRVFEFDPNTASSAALKDLGLSEKVANTILNYRKKGGKFYKKEDLKKIYGLRKEDYKRLENHIVFKEKIFADKFSRAIQGNQNPLPDIGESVVDSTKKVTEKTFHPKDKIEPILKIDVNRATVEEWQELDGIGPYFSKKIVKFREALGGFISIKQISETYNLPDSTFQKIKSQLEWSPIAQKININTARIDDLKKHPYLNFKQARGIVNYRKQHGEFLNIEDLKKVGGVVKPEDLERIAPYLAF